MTEKRTIKQIASSKGDIYALASDGSLWVFAGKWMQLPELPQEGEDSPKAGAPTKRDRETKS